jgi:hypothetical protein
MRATYSYEPANSQRRRQQEPRHAAEAAGSGDALPPPAQETRLRLLSAVNAMPPLPAVLTELLGILNDDDCSSTEIARLRILRRF